MTGVADEGRAGRGVRQQLLLDCAELEPEFGDLDTAALRTASVRMRDIFAAKATEDAWSYTRLHDWAHRQMESPLGGVRARSAAPTGLDGRWLTRLARVVALQNLGPHDHATALALYHLAHDQFDVPTFGPTHAKLYCDLMLWAGEDLMLHEVLGDLALSSSQKGLVLSDLENPHRAGPLAKPEPLWRTRFQSMARFPGGARLGPTAGGGRPFDHLNVNATGNLKTRANTLITVIMNVFRPDTALRGAVESLIAQSWDEIEVLIVDDGSGPDFADLFHEVASLDERLQLISLERNLGAYGARNVALEHARGTYVTFQDYDDWSLPQRLACQADVLEADSSLVATRARTTKLYEDLTFAHPGYRPHQIHAASLFFRRQEVMLGVGYFDDARKGADNEFHSRILAHFGSGACRDLPSSTPSLMAYRRTAGSLSRNEFRPGWRHPARWAYRNNYLYWHRHTPRDELFLEPGMSRPFPAPQRFLSDPTPVGSVDVLIVADWRDVSPFIDVAVDIATRVEASGGGLALVALESIECMASDDSGIVDAVQELIHNGQAMMVHEDTELHARVVVVIDPAVLQFADCDRVTWRVDEAWIIDPRQPEATGLVYLPDDCQFAATSMFGVTPRWAKGTAELGKLVGDVVSTPGVPS